MKCLRTFMFVGIALKKESDLGLNKLNSFRRIKYLPDHDTIMVNQRELLIKHFESRSSISGVEAATIYKIRSLPRRILDLKQMGYQFDSEWRTDPTGQRYKRYTLVSPPVEQ